jgi:hypothetical protein|nr:MAG TPA: hypothetical protein [Caudoviricetes sp.]
MRKQILLPRSVFRELHQTFKVHRVILSRALKYERNSKRDRMLRAAALERGGLIYTGERAPQGYCPNVETRHDHVRGMMYQNFGDRVELQVNRETNAATIIIDHEPVATFNDMTVATWGDVLYSLQKIYNQLNA